MRPPEHSHQDRYKKAGPRSVHARTVTPLFFDSTANPSLSDKLAAHDISVSASLEIGREAGVKAEIEGLFCNSLIGTGCPRTFIEFPPP